MELQDHEASHVCKFCNLSFFSGRILGGHMRSHLGRNSAKRKVKVETCDLGIESYGLRENPKKSWKPSGANHTDTVVSTEENVKCSFCRKQFDSPRSLNGHMIHHSLEERNGVRCKECGKGFRSLRSLTGHMRLHSRKHKVYGEESRPNLVSMTLSDADTLSLVRKKKRSNRVRYKAITPPFNSSFSSLNESMISDFENDQEVALCLMLLSRGLDENGYPFEANSLYPNEKTGGIEVGIGKTGEFCVSDSKSQIFECGDCDSVRGLKFELEFPILSGSMLYDTEIDMEIDESVVEFDQGGNDIKKRNEFQCRICNQNFDAYEALGGHQTFRRTIKSFTDGVEMEEEVNEAINVSNKSKDHKCHICSKNFESGQALGGHKRAHIGKAKEEAKSAVKHGNCNIIYDAIESGSNRFESLVEDAMAQAKNVVVSF